MDPGEIDLQSKATAQCGCGQQIMRRKMIQTREGPEKLDRCIGD
jgi:hypothetical protein